MCNYHDIINHVTCLPNMIYLNNIIGIILFQKDEQEFMYFEFVPSIESNAITDPFLPDQPEILVKTASPVPVIIGINNMEGMVAFGGKLFFNSILAN